MDDNGLQDFRKEQEEVVREVGGWVGGMTQPDSTRLCLSSQQQDPSQ